MLRGLVRAAVWMAALVFFSTGAAMADPINTGTLTLFFQNGAGTATGFFIYDPATNQITSWDFQLSGSANGAYLASTYNSADVANNAAGAIALPNSNGDQVFSFEENQPNQGGIRDEFDIVMACNGVPNCIANAAVGSSFSIVVSPVPCAPNALKCIPSAEQLNVPNGPGERFLAGGFFTVTDPNGLLAFNLSPSGGGGTNTGVPEPSTLFLSALGFAAFALKRSWG
jgi:hypothetical protein